jgi:hypothetical protein
MSKQLPAEEGSGAKPGVIKAHLSVNHVGPIHPTTTGCNALIIYEELATGYLVAFLCKTNLLYRTAAIVAIIK